MQQSSAIRRLTLTLIAACCSLLLLGADTDSGKARIALFEPAGQKEDAALAAVLSTMASSVELSLDVLQRWEVRRLPAADPVKDLARVRAYCQANRIDQAILGSGSARAGGGYQFKLVVYDRRADAITITQEGASKGALDMFDVTDTLVGSLLDGLSGTHLVFGSLSVDSEPEGAVITVNGKEVGAAPVSLRGMPVGTLEVVARTAGREETKAEVAIADGETTSSTLKLERSVGRLAMAMPRDAVAVVRSVEIGQKQMAGPGTASLPTGEYEVQASCAGLPAVSGRVVVLRNADTKWLPWTKGYLDVQADPADATVVVDGQELGSAPRVVEVEPGVLHRVELRKEKYTVYRSDVSQEAGEKTLLTGRLTPLPGSIRVETSLPGAYLNLDEDQNGVSPYVFENVEPGPHTLNIANIQVDKRDYTVGGSIQIDVKPGEMTTVTKTFVAGTSVLKIEDAPAGSVIRIGGKDVDSEKALTTGIEVPAGSLDLNVESPAGQEWHATTFVGAGLETQRSVYSMIWQIPRRTITIDGKTDDWEGLVPIWSVGENFNPYPDQPGTKIEKGYVCRDDKYLYYRYDFSNGSPRTRVSKEFKDLQYIQIISTNEGEVTSIVRFGSSVGTASGTLLGFQSTRRIWTDIGTSVISYKAGENTLEISVLLSAIKSRLKGPAQTAYLSVVNADPSNNGHWLSNNRTSALGIDFGL